MELIDRILVPFALESLIANVLGPLPRLRTLNVEVSVHENCRALAWIFPPDPLPPARLFATSIRLDPDLAAFLESQPEIRELSLRGISTYTSNPFTLPPSALPHLESFRSIHVDPDTLREGRAWVISTRPVQSISPSLFLEQGHRALEVLTRTSTPVRRLTIALVQKSPIPSIQPVSHPSPTSSSFLSYFMSTSPTGKTNASFPYRRPPGLGAPPVLEDEEGQEIGVRNFLHPRRATTGWAGNSSGHAASQTWLFRLVVPHDQF
ncbi:hypothetical protein BC826DRAFT_1174148 [Russula brevipes]|nr:hypothetical protein BC826DRAFT_1174148 [Russula brevipes]